MSEKCSYGEGVTPKKKAFPPFLSSRKSSQENMKLKSSIVDWIYMGSDHQELQLQNFSLSEDNHVSGSQKGISYLKI